MTSENHNYFNSTGLSTTQVINKATGKFNELFLGENKRNLDNLDDFHLAILDMFV